MPHRVNSEVIDWEGTYGISDAPSMGFGRGERYPREVDVQSARTGAVVNFNFVKYEHICGGAARHIIYRSANGKFSIHVYDA